VARTILGIIGCGGAVALGTSLGALTLELPGAVLSEETRSESPGSYDLPIARHDGQDLPVRTVEGAIDQRAYQLDAPGATTLAILAPLRDQVVASGYEVLLDCDATSCGGFDFRYGTDVLPEPDMHVDLGDFRFLAAVQDDEAISILVSRSALSAYVQITRVAPVAAGVPQPPDSPPAPVIVLDEEVSRGLETGALPDQAIGQALDTQGSAALEDLAFASGSASLAAGDYASLAAVAAWLEANPGASIALVGHTDASGSLVANVALSERRAAAAAEVLIDQYGADRERITAEGVGFLAPRATNQTEDGRQKNRRVEVIVTSTR
jgi:outer membrane protein OmpA-like peptidoglycan-associated protein